MSGTRHNSVLKIAKYFRYMGLELDGCIEELTKWMRNQNKKYYTSTLEDAISECERISRVVYEKEYSLVGHVDNLKVYKSEMKEIINIKEKNDKLLLFTMLLHSKRYSLKNGVFYMTYKQIEEMCGIGIDGAMSSLERLTNANYIEIVSRNIKQNYGFMRKPNKYKLMLDIDCLEEITLEIDNTSNMINNNDLYFRSVINSFSNKELKHLPVRQYKELTKYRNTLVS
jgi:hypothetical protein